MKTVLAPNAPWPKREEPAPAASKTDKDKPKKKPKPPKREPSKVKRTDEKFYEWLNKQPNG